MAAQLQTLPVGGQNTGQNQDLVMEAKARLLKANLEAAG